MKSLTILFVCFALSACGTTSGSWTKRPMLNANGEVVTNLLGFPVYEKIRISQHAAIAQAGAQAFQNKSNSKASGSAQCLALSKDQINALVQMESHESLDNYFSYLEECERGRATAQLVAAALGRPMSDGDAITRNYANIVASIEDGKSRRFQSGVNGITSLGTNGLLYGGTKAVVEGFRDVGISAAENSGDTTVGNISLSSSQHSSADGNTGGAASAGELGNATGGDGSGVASNTRSDPSPTIINIGDGNSAGTTSGTGNRTFVDTQSTLQLEASANGAANDDVNIDQQPIIDDNQGDQSNDPENGNGNSIF